MRGDWGEEHTCTLAVEIEEQYGVALEEAQKNPDFAHLYDESLRLCSDPSEYAGLLASIAKDRLHGERFVDELGSSFELLRTRLVAGSERPYRVAEALQIVVSDLPMIEEVAGYGAPGEVVDRLCEDLADAALFIAGRLVLNVGRSLRAKGRTPPPLDTAKVRPLSEALGSEPPEVSGSLEFEPGEPVLVVATAGRGTRLRTTIPKALLPLAGRPFLRSILDAAGRAGIRRAVAVVKHRADLHPPVLGSDLVYVIQKDALGTGHSFATALRLLEGHDGPCVLSYSDTPFLTTSSFRRVLEPVIARSTAMTILAVAAEAEPEFGRLDEHDRGVRAILQPRFGEQGGGRADGGLYACCLAETLPALLATQNANHRYEYSFTGVVAELDRRGHVVKGVSVADPREVIGVNRPADLILARRLIHSLRADLHFFETFGGPSPKDKSASRLLEISNRHVNQARDLVGALIRAVDSQSDEASPIEK